MQWVSLPKLIRSFKWILEHSKSSTLYVVDLTDHTGFQNNDFLKGTYNHFSSKNYGDHC